MNPLTRLYLEEWLDDYFKSLNSDYLQGNPLPNQLKVQSVELSAQIFLAVDVSGGATPNILGNGSTFIVPINGLSLDYNPDYSHKIDITMNACDNSVITEGKQLPCFPTEKNTNLPVALLKTQCVVYSYLQPLLSGVKPPKDIDATPTTHLTCTKKGVYVEKPNVADARNPADLARGPSPSIWNRLSQHRGSVRSGAGNHRGSIFRLIVGTALIAKHGYNFPTWDDRKSSAPADVRMAELVLEREVSKTIGAMQVHWVAIDDEPGDESARGYIERNAIALLSHFGKEPIDPPSPTWLGHYCNRPHVQTSGLWNADHVDEKYDAKFMDQLQACIEAAGL